MTDAVMTYGETEALAARLREEGTSRADVLAAAAELERLLELVYWYESRDPPE